MRAATVGLLALALASVAAAADIEVLSVTSATGGIWCGGRFSPIRLTARAPAGEHEVRARLEPGKVVVETLRSAGGEATVLLPLLPEADADGVEIDVGGGWTRHELRLRNDGPKVVIVGVLETIPNGPELAIMHRIDGLRQVRIPEGPCGPLRDACDVVLEPPVVEYIERLPNVLHREPVLSGPRVVRWLEEHAAGAEVGPDGVRTALPLLAMATLLVLALVIYGRGRGWPAFVVVAAATAIQSAVLLAGWVAFESGKDVPRATARGFSIVRVDGGRTDLLVLSSRGEATVRLDAGAGAILRPLPGEAGQIGDYVLRDGRVLEGVALGRGRRRYVRIDRGWTRTIPSPPTVEREVVDAYEIDADGATSVATGERIGLEAVWDRFRASGPQSPLGARGVLLRRIARPALVPGTYGFLRDQFPLHGPSMGVERAEILHALLVP